MSGGLRMGGGGSRGVGAARAALAMLAVLLAVGAVPLVAAAEHWAPPQTVFMTESGHTLDRLFLDVWRERSDLLGAPITEEIKAKVRLGAEPADEPIVQYFEHAALVYLGEEAPGEQVRLLDLGRETLTRELADPRPSTALATAAASAACGTLDAATCVTLAVPGGQHTVRLGFKGFWDTMGGAAWLGLPLTEEFRASGVTTQYFERAVLRWKPGGDVEPRPLGREEAKRLKLKTKRIDRPDSVPAYDPELFVAPPEPVVEVEVEDAPAGWSVGGFGPGPAQGGDKEVVISISAQALWAYEGGEVVNSTYVSTGTADVPETVTPLGYHQILSKIDIQTMEGTISDEYYNVPDVPWVMYFDNLGNALHGTYWHSNFGTPMSHGCVNLPLDVAAWMYGWAEVGTPVTVVG